MFVRWKTRKNTVYAYLCQSERKEGKPVSSTLGYLGSCSTDATPEQQQTFWEQVETNLHSLNLSEADRSKIEHSITQKIPRSTINQILSKQSSPKSSFNTFTKALKALKRQGGQLDGVLLEGVLEGLMDGVLILNFQGELVHASNFAYQILEEFTQEESQAQLISQEIERICQSAMESCELYPEGPIIIESEINNKILGVLRIRARWLQLNENEEPLILVTLEDQHRTIQSLVISEAQKYGLTPREAEIWLMRRTNRTYKEIANELFISLNSVKKHLKNIHTKLKLHQFRQELLSGTD